MLAGIARIALMFVCGDRLFAEAAITFEAGARELIASKAQRDSLGLNWFVDGNLGVLKDGGKQVMYGANGRQPFRITGTPKNPFGKVEPVTISTSAANFAYLSGGPVYRDPASGHLLLFYHAEIHRGGPGNFYAVLGLAIQTDKAGLAFNDLGPIFTPNVPENQAPHAIEVCGAPFVIKDGFFYVYARDEMRDSTPRGINLALGRAPVRDVVDAALAGKSVAWRKYYQGNFSEPALGGKSTPLETGNPGTRWMDVSYNTALHKFIIVIAANTTPSMVELFISTSSDGIHWTARQKLTDDDGESFYPSIVGIGNDPRQTGNEFYIYYTFSKAGGWKRWDDAEIVRRKITFQTAKE